MARMDIVIGAINRTKAVFGEVANQADTLNKRMQKVANIFRGLFVAGAAVKFGQALLKASSYTKELEASSEKVKGAWRGVATDIGDAFARIVLSVSPAIEKVGKFFDSMVNKLQFGGAFVGAMLGGSGFDEAKKIAEETVAELEKEQQARMQSGAIAAEESEAQKELNDLRKETNDLQQQLNKDIVKGQEAMMTDAQLLEKRKKQLEELKKSGVGVISFPGAENDPFINEANKQNELKFKINIVNLEQEIEELERKAAQSMDKADEKASGKRIIRFNRESKVGLGKRLNGFGRESEMARRSQERLEKARADDPSWKSANYLKDINDKIDSLLALKE